MEKQNEDYTITSRVLYKGEKRVSVWFAFVAAFADGRMMLRKAVGSTRVLPVIHGSLYGEKVARRIAKETGVSFEAVWKFRCHTRTSKAWLFTRKGNVVLVEAKG